MKTILGVNIDHVATLREARKGVEPEVLTAALLAEQAGAHGITIHLRQDRRHIQDRDLFLLKEIVSTKLNFEMSLAPEIVELAKKTLPDQVTLVPETLEEVTTEGGLDVVGQFARTQEVTRELKDLGLVVSHFIDPEVKQIEAAKESGASYIELHTGTYAKAGWLGRQKEYRKLLAAAQHAAKLGLGVNAGHGLNYHNVQPIAAIPEIEELNIGHAIISRAVFVGLSRAVREMVDLLDSAGESSEWPWLV